MIFEKIASILAEQFGIEQDEITMDTSFEDLGADSLDVVELTMALEEEFGIGEMEEEDLSGISTVSDLVRYVRIEQRMGRSPAAERGFCFRGKRDTHGSLGRKAGLSV